MGRGRPRKPTALRLVTGGRTRPHHSKSEPTPDPRAPIPPAWLQGRGLEAWNSVVDELTAIGCTSRLDAGILSSWASAMGTIAEAQEALNTLDSGRRLLITNKRGGPSVNPLIGVVRKAQKDAAHYATLLGLTPSSRAALEVLPAPRNPVDKYFSGGEA